MTEIDQKRLEQLNIMLEKDSWFGRQPYGAMPMKEAVQLVKSNPELIIASCAWWDYMPAGWTWCEILSNFRKEENPKAYHVKIDMGRETKTFHDAYIPEDEPVLVFYRNVIVWTKESE